MLITSCNHEKRSRLGTYCTHSVLNRRKRRAGGITICPDYIRPPRPNRSQCPDSCIRPYPEFWPFCPDKIRHRPSQEDDFVRIVYEAFKRHCRGSSDYPVRPSASLGFSVVPGPAWPESHRLWPGLHRLQAWQTSSQAGSQEIRPGSGLALARATASGA